MELREVAIFTDDVRTTAKFYERVVGEPVVAEESMALFDVEGVDVLVHETYEPAAGDLPCEDHYTFAVGDVDDAFARLSQQDLSVYREPADYDWGRSAYFRDDDGRLVEITSE
ncbi:VOC family protein [Halorussus limi]|uniref:VOC family protein n=1 Tax=Halorussus limi TaxID=2938695 RepID=A0A8U0HZR5_9EURY|nr:VOC family protein [Halorussus limi]UPV76161.1 VOC family protein [Halorussus limi]